MFTKISDQKFLLEEECLNNIQEEHKNKWKNYNKARNAGLRAFFGNKLNSDEAI